MTMKIRSFIIWFIVIVAVLIALALWHGKKQPLEKPLAGSTTVNAASSADSVPSAPVNASVYTNMPPAEGASSATTVTNQSKSPLPQDKVTVLKEILQANDVDIVFYGRLEDQFGSAIGNTTINFSVRYENMSDRGVQRGRVVADGNGFFKIAGYRGQDISIVPEKAGYTPLEMKGIGNYSPVLYPEDQRAHPDPNNPIVIKMWKLQGGEHLVHFQTETRVPLDGATTTFDLQTGQRVQNGGDLTISVKTTPTPNIRERYDWQVNIQSVNGGLISSSEDFAQMFQAPESSYEPEFSMDYQRDVKPWTTTFNGVFYFTSRNQGCYGKIGLEVLSDVVKDGTIPVILNCYLNPAGSRNLEIDPAKVTEAHP
jgi:hypothetical protein